MKIRVSTPWWTSLAADLRTKAGPSLAVAHRAKAGRRLPALLLTAALLSAGSGLAADKPDSATTAALKRISDRYALTKTRIATLLDQRVHPAPLPNNLPNPFYRPSALPVPDDVPATPADVVTVPAAPDVSDADTLAKFVASVKIGGVIDLGGQPRLSINSTLCKVGDVIPAGTKDHPVYIAVVRITPDEVTLGLNQSEQTFRVRR